MRTIFIGIDPGPYLGEDPFDPIRPSGRRFMGLCGLSREGFLRVFDRTNLHPYPHEGDDLEAAIGLLPLLRGRRVVCLGRQVSAAFGTPESWMEWDLCNGFVGASLSHPSRRNTWWDSPKNRVAGKKFLLDLLKPCIHIEGPDGSGKTVLSYQLAKLLGLKRVATDDPPTSWSECQDRIRKRIQPGIVCDRSSGLISELVYGPVIRGGTHIHKRVIWGVIRSLLHAVVFIYCDPPKLTPSFRPGEDGTHKRKVRARLNQLRIEYRKIMIRLCREGARVIWYNRTRQTVEEIVQCVGLPLH